MLEIAVIAIIGSSVLMIMTGFWAYHKLSGPQIFQRTNPSRHHNVRQMKRKGQKGYIKLFSEIVIKKRKTVKSRNGRQIKVPWGW